MTAMPGCTLLVTAADEILGTHILEALRVGLAGEA